MFIICSLIPLLSCNTKHGRNSGENDNETDIKQLSSDSIFSTLKQVQDTQSDWKKIYSEQDKTFSLDSFNYVSEYSD